MAKLLDLIAKCDDAEMFTQNLDDNATEWQIKGKNGYVTFLTDPQIVKEQVLGKQSKIAFVIWLPSDVFER